MTPLAAAIRELILAEGPIGLDRFMALALGHPRHGYYITRDPLGAAGDFTTAPEISQMFGEMIGLWCAAVAEGMEGPLRLVELGPGRGTLMADLLRAIAVVPRLRTGLAIHLVETSPVLAERQASRLAEAGHPLHWHADIDDLPDGPAIVIANEFFDALPVRHYCRTRRGWCERLVGLDAEGALVFGVAATPEPRLLRPAPEGSILEVGVAAQAIVGRLAARLVRHGGAALVIDYGYTAPTFGETLQALQNHAFVDPLAKPGEADLTTHVDFAGLARVGAAGGATVHGPVPQGAFLRDMGIGARADQLARRNPAEHQTLAAALARLCGAGDADAPGMGELFKVLALTAPGLSAPPGFGAASPAAPPARPMSRHEPSP